MKRIFIGLKVEAGEIMNEMIASLKAGLSAEKIKWTNLANIHVTIAFLGNTEENRIPQLSSMLKERCEGYGRFDLILKGAGVFRSMNDPRILWTGIESSEKLKKLNEIVVEGLKSIEIPVEDRPYNPHLTLGRIKNITDRENLRKLIQKYENITIQTVPVNEIILYESILLQAGPLYKPLTVVNL